MPKNERSMVKTENEFYREYKRLGGKKTRAKYKTLLKKFYIILIYEPKIACIIKFTVKDGLLNEFVGLFF